MNVRWKLAGLVSVAIAISYLDRQALPVAIKAIQQDIPVSNERFALLNTAFLIAYGLMYAGGGKLIDLLGTKRGFLWVMVFWSLACASHGLATSFPSLAMSRLLLGMGEGGGFPAATRAVAEWFPVAERSTAMGVINTGTAVGGLIAPPLIALVIHLTNWRSVFFLAGSLGLLWTLWWRRSYFRPEEHPSLSAGERQLIEGGRPPSAEAPVAWRTLFKYRQTWGLMSAKFLSDAAWYFLLFWLPKYLYDVRHFDIKSVGAFAWIPYAAAGVGCLLGGWFSSWLLGRNRSVNFARKMAMGLSAAVMPFILLVSSVPTAWCIALFALAYFGQQSWSTIVMILPTDLFPKNAVGAVAGLIGFAGAMGGVVFGQLAGYLLDHGWGYGPVFTLAGSFHVVAFFIILLAVPRIQPLNLTRAVNPSLA